MGIRKILHLDLDAFFCSVEELRRPELVGKPFAVGGQPGQRGVVASCSYAARQFGVHSAMPMSRAMRLCPGLEVVSSSHRVYGQYSEQVMAHLRQLTPLVEQVSIDEAFLDVSDLPEEPGKIAIDLHDRINEETHLPCSLGVATNKLMAKIANDFGKSQHRGITPPNAITVVTPGQEAEFLAPLPVQALWGVGPKTAARLQALGIVRISELANQGETFLIAHFGRYGRNLFLYARGIDDQPLSIEHEVKSISQEITYERDVSDPRQLDQTLREMASMVAYKLRQERLTGKTVRVKLRWPDFSTHTRQVSLNQPTDQDGIILASARALLGEIWEPDRAVRLLGVGVAGLCPAQHQLTLWETPNEKERKLLEAVDQLRERFGKRALVHADELERKHSH
jgi:DNA polymerase IV